MEDSDWEDDSLAAVEVLVGKASRQQAASGSCACTLECLLIFKWHGTGWKKTKNTYLCLFVGFFSVKEQAMSCRAEALEYFW